MIVAWRLALRDLGRSGRGLILLAACLFLGTASLAGIGSLSASILGALDAQGHVALGGDLEMRVSQRLATIEEQAAFAQRGRLSETVRMRAMAQAGAGTPALVDLKGVDNRWPLVGRLTLSPGARAARPQGLQVALAPALAERLGVRIGDEVRIGTAKLIVIGLIANEPDQLGEGLRFGMPAIIDRTALDATGLIQPGSLYEARYRLRLPAGVDAKATGEALLRAFPGAGWQVRTADQATGSLRRGIDQLGQFLLLVGLAALTISGVGVGSGISAYLGGKRRMIAMLKVLGARSPTIMAIFLLELGLVAGGAILSGLVLGAAVPVIVSAVAGNSLPVPPRIAIYPEPLMVATAMGLLVALLFALPALGRARAVPAATLLRDTGGAGQRLGWPIILLMALLIAALVALAVGSASDRPLALGFIGATVLLLAMLALLGVLIRFTLARVPRPKRPLLRMALANLHRPGAQTGQLVLALGLGFSLFVALAVIDTSLSSEIKGAAPAKAPRFFAVDLQPEDEARFRAAIDAASPGASIQESPSFRGAVVALNGVTVLDRKSLPDNAWILRGDRTLTWSATVPPRNQVVAGHWWPADYHGPPLVSIGQDAAQALNLKVGDSMTISVLGVDVTARIAALRKIDWSGYGMNFAIIFSPGYIEEAPHSLLASVYTPADSDGAIMRTVAAALPSVTLVRVGDVLGQISDLLARIAIAIRAAAAVTIVAGIAVLIGAVAASSRARRYDAVILKLLGGMKAQILGAQALEYTVLAILLVIVALAVGGGAGWYVVVEVFGLPFAPSPLAVAITLLGASMTTLAIGLLGSISALSARPAESLRTL